MKIDVEGAELRLLQGSQQTITKHKPILMLELNAATALAAGFTVDQIVSWLESHGYFLFEIGFGGRLVPFVLSRYEESVQRDSGATQNLLCITAGDDRRTVLGV